MQLLMFLRANFVSFRHSFLRLWLMGGLLVAASAPARCESIVTEEITTYRELQQAAEQLSRAAFVPQPPPPEHIAKMTYDDWRLIWPYNHLSPKLKGDRPYRLEFFHKGYVAKDDVTINLISGGKEKNIPFTRDWFEYRGHMVGLPVPWGMGFAGMRVAGVYPGSNDVQEIITFLGASYFRTRAAEHVYGTSARGLAVNCGLPQVEEFPVFREFWVVEDEQVDGSLRLLALMDSESVTGAYDFTVHPGIEKTDVDVTATLYFRQIPKKVGFAPLTSMWMWGDGLKGPVGDERPEVHDADGLLLRTSDGKWTWRALGRLEYPSLVSFPCENPVGFGLIQRDRDQSHYLDPEAKYHARPSVWVTPRGDWGPGRIELLEMDASNEGTDNINAWWVSDQPLEANRPLEIAYQVSFCSLPPMPPELATSDGYRVSRENPGVIELEVDFSGPTLASRPAGSPPQVQVQSARGHVTVGECRRQPSGAWTVAMRIQPTGEGPIEITAILKDGDQELSESWKYLCPLTPPPVSLPPWRLKELNQEQQP